MTYVGVTLSLFAMATVAGAIVLRWRAPDLPRPYRTWGYPLTPLVFLAIEGWMIVFTVWTEPISAAWSAATMLLGLVIYLAVRESSGKRQLPPG
jgi:APA family basic amino acid/polyamine antiporter